MINDVKKMI